MPTLHPTATCSHTCCICSLASDSHQPCLNDMMGINYGDKLELEHRSRFAVVKTQYIIYIYIIIYILYNYIYIRNTEPCNLGLDHLDPILSKTEIVPNCETLYLQIVQIPSASQAQRWPQSPGHPSVRPEVRAELTKTKDKHLTKTPPQHKYSSDLKVQQLAEIASSPSSSLESWHHWHGEGPESDTIVPHGHEAGNLRIPELGSISSGRFRLFFGRSCAVAECRLFSSETLHKLCY